jgi:hypothetical protein
LPPTESGLLLSIDRHSQNDSKQAASAHGPHFGGDQEATPAERNLCKVADGTLP